MTCKYNGCESLTSLTIGSGTKEIGNNILFGSKLSHITCLATIPPSCTNATFSGVDKKTSRLSVPEGSVADYKVANEWKDFFNIDGVADIESVVIGAGQKAIDSIYDLNGRQQQGIRRGVNIVRMSDGTTRKVVEK